MKKGLFGLILALLLIVPFKVKAATYTLVIPEDNATEVDVDETHKKKTYDVYYEITDADTDSELTVKEAEVGFSFAEAITNITCNASDDFSVTQDSQTTSPVSCKFTATSTDGVKGEKILLGTVSITYDIDESKSCDIEASLKGGTGLKLIPNTGDELPYVLIGAGALLVVGIFVVTRRQAKLQKI